jgi:hypothetical protein
MHAGETRNTPRCTLCFLYLEAKKLLGKNDSFGSILLKKSDLQIGRTHARSPPENLLTTLSGFLALR